MNTSHLVAQYMNGFFHQYMGIIRGLSDKTIIAYRDALKLLLCFAADSLARDVDDLVIEDLDDKVILTFLDYVENERQCSVRTRNARFAAISTFFNFIGREEPALLPQCHRIRTIPLKRYQHKTIDYLDEKEIQVILNSINPTSRTGARDMALLLFLFNTGARAQEAVDLPIEHLRLDSQGQVKIFGKGQKERACPLWPETVNAVDAYLARRTAESSERRLFLNANGRAITRFGVRHIVQKYASQAAQKCPSLRKKKVGPHTMRHSTAIHMLRAGNDINMISQWLGHASINTTHMYAEIDISMKRAMLDRCSAPTSRRGRPEWQKPKTIRWLDALSGRAELCGAR
jgi:site-specific recombinase XerD